MHEHTHTQSIALTPFNETLKKLQAQGLCDVDMMPDLRPHTPLLPHTDSFIVCTQVVCPHTHAHTYSSSSSGTQRLA